VDKEERKRKDRIRQQKNREKKRKYVMEYKERSCCAVCGVCNALIMDFHHIDSKYNSVSRIVNNNNSLETLKKEINKCVTICGNCHRCLHMDNDFYKNSDIKHLKGKVIEPFEAIAYGRIKISKYWEQKCFKKR